MALHYVIFSFLLFLTASIVQSLSQLGYGLDNRGVTFRFPLERIDCSLPRRIQTGSGTCSIFYPIGKGNNPSESKAAEVAS